MYEDLKTARRARLVLMGACLAIIFTAFEVRWPLVTLGPVSLTTSEVAALLFFVTAALWAATEPRRFFTVDVMDLAVCVFLATNFLSAAAAEDKPSALKFSLRMTFAALVYLGVSRLPSKARIHLIVAGAVSVVLFLVTLVGLMETFVRADWEKLLSIWREDSFSFGGAFWNVRTTSTLPFPTTLAMYLELTLPLALAVWLWLISRREDANGFAYRLERRRLALGLWLESENYAAVRRILLYGCVVAFLAGVMEVLIYTSTRTALVAMPLSMMSGALLAALFGYGRRAASFFALAVIVMVACLGISAAFSNQVASRIGLAEQTKKYAANYTIVEKPASFRLGQRDKMTLKVTNTSDVTWKWDGIDRVMVSSRWHPYTEDSPYPLDKPVRLPFEANYLPHDVHPGEEAVVEAKFINPEEPGRYMLVMELHHKDVSWFSNAGVTPVFVHVEFSESSSREFTSPVATDKPAFTPPAEIEPSRRQLWRAAIDLWKDSPLLGVGPDQFRKRYGEILTDFKSNEKILTNNTFLESLVNTGVIGLAALLFLFAVAGWRQLKLIRNRSLATEARLVALALSVALQAFLIHGLLDSFLAQTSIAFLLFVQLGLTAWLERMSKVARAG